ncbi:O-antigen ligase family protein [Rubripirellula reticaptiva]|uniref:O-Antigen ligase n=1 Tax=Rubripirellula reticaptiva TaxID=2528013 RepID=A0A5C6EMM1_9BACT|nr:O-antigen ligase family protein [Rubripirellula reticaptiva]TWU49387.1 O-Antigen ligase [Rubripirellula reticaptiva]
MSTLHSSPVLINPASEPTTSIEPRKVRWLDTFAKLSLWSLSIMVYTMPSTTYTQSWQPLDLAKLVVLAVACGGGVAAIASVWSSRTLKRVLNPLAPFYLFLGWTLTSVLWSPLKSVTIAQSGGLVAMLLFASIVAFLSVNGDRAKQLLQHLNWMFLVSSAVVLIAYLINPEMSGLDRGRIHSGGDGLIHPTAAGATASLGLLLPVLCHWVGGFMWARKLIAPSLIIHGAVLVLSNSRTALAMGVVTIGAILFWYSSNRQRAIAIFTGAVLAFALLLFDPGFELVSSTADAGTQFVSRGQSSEQIKAGSGRGELWEAVWAEYKKSMLIGHGYFVTSETGKLHVWNETHNYTAHNLALQILASTGAIGFLMFAFALIQAFGVSMSLRHGNLFQRQIAVMVITITVWFAGWSQLGDSFLGPIRPESILFFTMLGIAIGQSTLLVRPNETAFEPPQNISR